MPHRPRMTLIQRRFAVDSSFRRWSIRFLLSLFAKELQYAHQVVAFLSLCVTEIDEQPSILFENKLGLHAGFLILLAGRYAIYVDPIPVAFASELTDYI